MTVIRVSPAIAAAIRQEALRGNPLFSLSNAAAPSESDSVAIVLESASSGLPQQYRANVATSRMRQAQHSPVTAWRPGISQASM